MKSYSQLSIHAKINKKAYWVNYAATYGTAPKNWFVMKADAIIMDLGVI